MLKKWYEQNDGSIICQMSRCTPNFTSLELGKDLVKVAKQHNVGLNIDCGQGYLEQKTFMNLYCMRSLEILNEAGILNYHTLLN